MRGPGRQRFGQRCYSERWGRRTRPDARSGRERRAAHPRSPESSRLTMREPLPWLDRLERALARPGAVTSDSPAGEARVDLDELCARVVAEARTEQAAAARRLDRL